MELEQQILKIISGLDNPADSGDVCIYLDAKFNVQCTRRKLRHVLTKMALSNELDRVWVEQTDKASGHWLYSLPKRLPGLPSMEEIMGHVKNHAFCIANRVRGVK